VTGVLRTDSSITHAALAAEQAMPPSHQARARELNARVTGSLDRTAGIVLGLFVGALVCGLGPARPMLLLASVILLKIGVHTLTVAQPRYFVLTGALALMGLALAFGERGRRGTAARAAGAAVVAVAFACFAARLGHRAERYVIENEEQLTYRFWVWSEPPIPPLRCTMASGLLQADGGPPTIRLLRPDPAPGDEATVECVLQGVPPPIALEVLDSYGRHGLPGRIVQSVSVDGREVLRHDIGAEPGWGWVRVPLAGGGGRAPRTIVVRVLAVKPERGWDWGLSARATFRLVRL
jgi:hypothetical protein